MVGPSVVPDELWKGVRLTQERVDDLHDLVLVDLPDPPQPGPQGAYRPQLGLVVLALAGPAVGAEELVERGEVGQRLLAAATGVHQRGGRHQCRFRVMS